MEFNVEQDDRLVVFSKEMIDNDQDRKQLK